MNHNKEINQIRKRRAKRARTKIKSSNHPRLSVFTSNKYIYAQVINDSEHKTKVSISSRTLDKKGKNKEVAKKLGKAIAEKAKKEGIDSVVFDKGKYAYHGKIKALADSAREAGLKL